MKSINKTSIVGMGALGLLFADIIQKNSLPVEFVMDKKRSEKYSAENFTINGQKKTFKITSEEEATPSDLVIVAVKGTGLESCISTVKRLVKEDTVIISLLNGISSEGILADSFGRSKIISTVAQGMDAMKFQNSLTYTKTGELHIGNADGENRENLEALVEYFKKSGIPFIVEQDIMRRMWSKFMLNVGINQTCMAFKATYSQVLNQKELLETFTGAMNEVIAIANKEGIDLNEADLQQYLAITKTLSPDGTPSMGQDRINGKKSEVELFSGTVIRIAEKHGIPVPVNKMLYEKIKEIESHYSM